MTAKRLGVWGGCLWQPVNAVYYHRSVM